MYKNRNPYYWAFLILFLPAIGCLIYLVTQVYNKRDAEKLTSEITHIINPTKKINDLEKQLEFSETYQNRVNLADALLELGDFKNAIPHYLEALEDVSQKDVYVVKQLIECYFNLEDWDKVILNAKKIDDHVDFKKSRSQFLYGLAFEKLDRFDEAESHLSVINIRYSFYNERLVYAKFLLNRGKLKEAKEILEDIQKESQHMTKPNRRLFGSTIQDVEKALNSL